MTRRGAGALARFAVERGKVTTKGAHQKLFEPMYNKKDGVFQLSVSRIHDLDCPAIQQEGFRVVERHKNAKKIYGWAEIKESAVTNLQLAVEDDTPPPRHANIVGWPDKREEKKAKSLELASATAGATVRLSPPLSPP